MKKATIIVAMVHESFSHLLNEDAKSVLLSCGIALPKEEENAVYWHLVLYLDATPISYGRIKEVDPETYLIEEIAVRSEIRHRQIGSYTAKYLYNKAISLGARKMMADTAFALLPFWKKLGYRPLDGVISMREGTPYLLVIKRKPKPRYSR